MEKIYTKNAPDAIGPYSQAIKTGNLLFTSGQIAIVPETSQVEAADIEGQTEQVCKNLSALLEASGTSIEKVIKTTCFLADMNDFAAFKHDMQALDDYIKILNEYSESNANATAGSMSADELLAFAQKQKEKKSK